MFKIARYFLKFILFFSGCTLYYTKIVKKSILFNETEGLVTDFRTDLALERHELLNDADIQGIQTEFFSEECVRITKIKITDSRGAKSLGKPEGTYITVEIPPLTKYCDSETALVKILARELSSLLPSDGTVLTAGLGNQSITPDALGPACCEMILATRHIEKEFALSAGLGSLRPSAVISPGVLGQTGVETAEIIKGMADFIKPSAVIVIDALAARKMSRLGCTVQMSDSGIVPGSGVGNNRSRVSRETLGVPVISVGIPTVVDAHTLASELSGNAVSESDEENMIITPREIDLVISRGARLLGLAVNKALQPHISVEEMLSLVTSV